MNILKYSKKVLIIFIAIFFATSCKQPGAKDSTNKLPDDLKENILSHFVDCGDTYYVSRYFTEDPGYYYELKKPLVFHLHVDKLSRADKANGITWKGNIAVTSGSGVYRSLRSVKRWNGTKREYVKQWEISKWRDGSVKKQESGRYDAFTEGTAVYNEVTKQNGQWSKMSKGVMPCHQFPK